jgi:tetratricopeptide (TPR) repeat protein
MADLLATLRGIVALAGVLLALALLTRLLSGLWFRWRARDGVPMVVYAIVDDAANEESDGGDTSRTPAEKAESDRLSRELVARIVTYIAEDAPGPLAPGVEPAGAHEGGGPQHPPVTPTEAPDTTAAWVAALTWLALARRPAYEVRLVPLARVRPDVATKGKQSVAVEIATGGRVVAAKVITGEDIVAEVGCYCIQQVSNQPDYLRRTPRWERWSADGRGYWEYRRGLALQRKGELEKARDCFQRSSLAEPANLLPRLFHASLLEALGQPAQAVKIYEMCRELWPEYIETNYRLAAAYPEGAARQAAAEMPAPAKNALSKLEKQLTVSALAAQWLKTWRPSRWSPAERRYWAGWFRPWHGRESLLSGHTKRREFLAATTVAYAVIKLRRRVSELGAKGRIGDPYPDVAKVIGDEAGRWSGTRLLAPERVGRAGSKPPALKQRIGWLAHYNAACFYSLAIALGDDDCWRRACTEVALNELGSVLRNPYSLLDPTWFETDKDLAPLKERPDAQSWILYAGLPGSRPTRWRRLRNLVLRGRGR